jgi:hypothetical protein
MQEKTALVVIECPQETADGLRREFESLTDAQFRVAERRNLDGSEATWIVVATLALQALPQILTFISTRRTTKIKVGNIEIENPTQEDLERLRKFYAKAVAPEKEDD